MPKNKNNKVLTDGDQYYLKSNKKANKIIRKYLLDTTALYKDVIYIIIDYYNNNLPIKKKVHTPFKKIYYSRDGAFYK
jgi:hypothetical protein